MSDPLHPKTAAEAAEAWMRNVPADDPKMPEPVAWLVVNGWQPVAVHLASASASADRYRRQMSHDLSGSLSAHSTVPLITTEAAQAYAEALAAELDEARAERSVAYLAFEQVTAERDATGAA